MLTNIAHHIVAHPLVYDQVQRLVGITQIHQRFAQRIAPLQSAETILDLGGGTGLLRHLWPGARTYICLDIDALKLRGFRDKHPDGIALLSDATATPIGPGSIDVVLCIFVAHHLDDALLQRFLAESTRILRPGGTFILMDPVWDARRWAGRLLWRYDRGSYPRTPATLEHVLTQHFAPVHREQFALWHRYLLWMGRPR